MKRGKRIVAFIIVLSMLFAQQPTIAGNLWKEEKQNTTLETIKESKSRQNTQKQENNVKQEIDDTAEITETDTKEETVSNIEVLESKKQEKIEETENQENDIKTENNNTIDIIPETAKDKTSDITESTEPAIENKIEQSIQALSEEEIPTIAQYKANYFIDSSTYKYYLDEFENPYRVYVNEGKENGLSAGLLAWRAGTFNLTSELILNEKEKSFYEMLLMDILYDGENQNETSLIKELDKTATATNAGLFKSILKAGDTVVNLNGNTEKDKQDTWEYLKKDPQLSSSVKLIEKLELSKKILGWAKTGEEIIKGVGKLQTLSGKVDDKIPVLLKLSDNTTNPTMNSAITQVSAFCIEAISEDVAKLVFVYDQFAEEAMKMILKTIGSEVANVAMTHWPPSLNPFFEGMKIGQQVGKVFSNAVFSTDKIMEDYYCMVRIAEFEELLKPILKSYESNYRSNRTDENARLFLSAMDMYVKTQNVGIKYAKKFFKTCKTEGVINETLELIRVALGDKRVEKSLESFDELGKTITQTFSIEHAVIYNEYQELYCQDVQYLIDTDQYVENIDETKIEENVETIKEISNLLSGITIKEDTMLQSDMETYGDLVIENGTLNLNGYTLNVAGDIIQSGGTLLINNGIVNVDGDYRIQRKNVSGAGEVTYGASSGILKMTYPEDRVNIKGDFITQSQVSHTGYLTNGIMIIEGDLEVDHNGLTDSNFNATQNHKVVFKKKEGLNIKFVYDGSGFANVEFVEGAEVTIEGEFRGCKINEAIVLNGGLNLESGTLEILAEDMTINGEFQIRAGVNLHGNTLQINGDVIHTKGTLFINNGTININGNYRIQNKWISDAGETIYEVSDGILKMTYPEDKVNIKGDFITQSKVSHTGYLTNGIMTIEGNFEAIYINIYNADYGTFNATQNHKVVFKKKEGLNIKFEKAASGFANVKFVEGANVTIKGEFRGCKINENITLNGGLSLKSGILEILAENVMINGEFQIGAGVNLHGNTLQINGDVIHTEGTLFVNNGTINIDGNYRIQSKKISNAGKVIYETSSGILEMTYPEDRVNIKGNFITQGSSAHTGYLINGIIVIEGDFKAIYTSSYRNSDKNFDATQNHRVVFKKKEGLNIKFESAQSGFANVEFVEGAEVTIKGPFRGCKINENITLNEGLNLGAGRLDILAKNVTINGEFQIGANVNLHGNMLQVNGGVLHTNGEIFINGGTFNIEQDYHLENRKYTDSGDVQYDSSSGTLKMKNSKDKINIKGNCTLYNRNHPSDYLTKGVITVYGDFWDKSSTYKASDSNKLKFMKLHDLEIRTDSSDTQFANIEFLEGSEVSIKGQFRGCKIEQNITLKDGLKLMAGTLNVLADKLTVDGELQIRGNINLQGHELQINGNVLHENGEVVINGGTLCINGDYRMQRREISESGVVTYGRSSARLNMSQARDNVIIKRDFFVNSQSDSTLTNGVMKVGRDFTEECSRNYNFQPTKNHKVVLNGTELQYIIFESSQFHILELGQPRNQYIFSPNPCWNELIECIEIESISLNKSSLTLEEGKTEKLLVTILPENTTMDKTIIWTSSDESIAIVENGIVTAVKEGNATITAKVGDKIANCSVTVKKKESDHKLVKTNAVSPTCTKDGHEEYWTCSICKKMFGDADSNQEINEIPLIKATGHKLSYHEAVNATVEETGSKEYWKCENCNKYYTDEKGETEVQWEELEIEKLILIQILSENGNYSVNGEEYTEKTETGYEIGTELILKVLEEENFAYWTNVSGTKLSEDTTCTVRVTDKDVYTAVYNRPEEEKSIVVWQSDYNQIIQRGQYGKNEEITEPIVPNKLGYVANGWNMTVEEIKAEIEKGTEVITITPNYKLDKQTYHITVINGTGSGTYDQKDIVTATADEAPEGKKFSHWQDVEGTVFSYNETYLFYATQDYKIEAVFIESEVTVTSEGTAETVQIIKNNDTNKISFVSTMTIPVGCSIVSAGAIMTNDTTVGTSGDGFNKDTAQYVGKRSTTAKTYVYTITKSNVKHGEIWYARAYLVYTDEKGNIVTIYGNMVSASLN